MAEHSIPIQVNNKEIGSIKFEDSPESFELQRTALGHNLRIPAVVHLNWDDREQPHPILKTLELVVSCYDGPGKLELGRIRDDTVYFGTTFGKGDLAQFDWINAAPALIYLEGSRPSNTPPRLNFYLRAQLYFLVKAPRVPPPNVAVIEPGYNSVLTFPHKILGNLDITYTMRAWNGLMKKLIKPPL